MGRRNGARGFCRHESRCDDRNDCTLDRCTEQGDKRFQCTHERVKCSKTPVPKTQEELDGVCNEQDGEGCGTCYDSAQCTRPGHQCTRAAGASTRRARATRGATPTPRAPTRSTRVARACPPASSASLRLPAEQGVCSRGQKGPSSPARRHSQWSERARRSTCEMVREPPRAFER